MQENEKLTPRQWELYKFIKFNSLVNHQKTTQEQIYLNIEGYFWNKNSKSHDHCPAIWNDIRAINESTQVDKVIIYKDFKYWIGSEKEVNEFTDGLWKMISKRLVRYWNIKNKSKLDGQGKLLSNSGRVIDEESLAHRFKEVFNSINISEATSND